MAAAKKKKLTKEEQASRFGTVIAPVSEAPPRIGMYLVRYQRTNFENEIYVTVGYWSGADWEWVSPEGDYKPDPPRFEDRKMRVMEWATFQSAFIAMDNFPCECAA